MTIEYGEAFVFSTGRKVNCNKGIIGLNPELKTYEGYDGDFCLYISPLTKEERIELADYMIGLWTKYKEVEV